jgi:uncharacterized protein HemX
MAGEHERIIKQAEQARRQRDQWEGRLAVAMEKLKEDFDVDTIEVAEALLKSADAEVAKAEKRYKRELDRFKKEFGDDITP